MALTVVGSFNLGQINVGLLASLGFLNPMAAQLDLFLTGQFGLGPFLAQIQAQFNAAISAQANLGIQVSNPFATIQALIAATAQLQAAIQALAAIGFPAVSLQLSAQIAAAAALSASLAVQIGGIKAMIAGALAVKLPAIDFIAQLTAQLQAGPVYLLSFDGDNLATTGAELASQFSAGLGPTDPIAPTDPASGVVLVTKTPSAFAAMSAIIRTS